MKKNLFVTIAVCITIAACMNETDNEYLSEQEENVSLTENAMTNFLDVMGINPSTPNLTFHDIIIIDDAVGGCCCGSGQTGYKDLSNAVILSLITPLIQDYMSTSPLPGTLQDQQLINPESQSLTNNVPASPLNGNSYTFNDSIGYYHNLIISEILENDPYGDSLFAMNFPLIVRMVDNQIEQMFGLSYGYFHAIGYDLEQISMCEKISYILHNYTDGYSFLSLLTAEFPTLHLLANYIVGLSQGDMSYTSMNQALNSIPTLQLPSVTEQMKKITLIEYASNKLWR